MKKIIRHSLQMAGFNFKIKRCKKNVLACMFFLMPALLFSQEKTVEKANLAYKYKQYAQAASLFETVIAEKEGKNAGSTSTLNLKTKLAYCYRMNNKMNKAEKLYAEIVEDERAKSKTYLYYGETLMCNGKYEEAKKWFADYQILEPNDKQAALLSSNCDKIQFIEPYFPHVDIQPFAYNSEADDNAPVAWQNGVVFSSDRKQGIKFMKEKSGWTGRDYLDLYFSVLNENGAYSEPRRFSSKLSEVNKNTCNASFSMDGKEVFFTRNDNVLNKKETYNLQLFRSENNGNGRWKKAEKLPFCNPNFSFMHPAISPDGKHLYFASNKKGEGGVDLWVSTRKVNLWSKPKNLGPAVNTPANEGFPFVDENGRLYFCSKGHPGYGGFDIFFTEMDENGQWKTPQNLGQPINGPLDDISIYINSTGQNGMFTSSRGGGDDNIYFFEVLEEIPVTEQLADIVPVANDGPEKYINKKPTALQPLETAIEVAVEKKIEEPVVEKVVIEEEPILERKTFQSADSSVPGVPENYQPVQTATATTPLEEARALEQPEKNDPVNELPFSEVAIPEETIPTKEETSSSGNIFFELPAENRQPEKGILNEKPIIENSLFTFNEFMDGAHRREIVSGHIYRIDGATFDPNVWQLTPRVSKKLNDLVSVMRRFPGIQIELSAHTESLGSAEQNLEISKNRANMAVEYMLKEGISQDRIKGIGFGEIHPLNHCAEGVQCSMAEHLFNQRLEVRVVNGIDQ